MALIELDDVSLTFRVRQFGRITLKEQFIRHVWSGIGGASEKFLGRRIERKTTNPVMKVRALRNVNLRIDEGDRVGIIGRNGAGKSTMLKLLAGIYPPTRGQRMVEGRISSLFEITLGFEMEANGWENIAFRSYLQGETPRSIRSKMQGIADFTELGDFLNMPVRYYSAGMLVRLAFSIATAIEPEILLVDEVLSVGDMAFQQKARQRMQDMMAKAQLIVMVSHDLNSLAQVCDQCVWLDRGTVRQLGPTAEIVNAYTEFMNNHKSRAA